MSNSTYFFTKQVLFLRTLSKGGDEMKFDHSKLLGRIRECGFTQKQLAKAIGMSKTTLSAKLNNQFYFTAKEMYLIGEVLNIPTSEFGEYFFAV